MRDQKMVVPGEKMGYLGGSSKTRKGKEKSRESSKSKGGLLNREKEETIRARGRG